MIEHQYLEEEGNLFVGNTWKQYFTTISVCVLMKLLNPERILFTEKTENLIIGMLIDFQSPSHVLEKFQHSQEEETKRAERPSGGWKGVSQYDRHHVHHLQWVSRQCQPSPSSWLSFSLQ